MNNILQETDQFKQTVSRGHQTVETRLERENSETFLERCIRLPHSTIPDSSVYRDAARLQRASWAHTTRRIDHDEIARAAISQARCSPNVGDLVLASVDALGHHTNLQLADGRRKKMFVGDEIVVAYGNRYASSQFEALIPKSMDSCHLVAGGGVASRAICWHNRIEKGPTQITPIGLLVDADGKRINLRDFALDPVDRIDGLQPPTIAVVGSGMDSGKTTSAAYLVKGLIAGGLRVGYAKITGTGAGGDTWLLKDAGASPVLDFTDAGMATTYMASPEEIEAALKTLVGHVAQEGVDAIVIEVADGVYQRETSTLLRSKLFAQMVSGIMFTAGDAMGANSGVSWLNAQPTQVLALSGILSASPLQSKEAKAAMGLPVYTTKDLSSSSIALDLLDRARQCIEADRGRKAATPLRASMSVV